MGTNTYATALLVPTSVHIQDFSGASDLDVASVIKVAAANTTTTLSVSPSSAIAGQTVTLTAQVTPSAGNTANNGFVLFQDNGLPLAVVPVDSKGAATFNATKLSLGSHSLSASFLGTPDFNASASTAVQKVVSADVTGQFGVTLGSARRRGRYFVQHVTLKNNGATLSDPLALVLDGLRRGVKLFRASGVTKTVDPLGSTFVFISLGSSNQIASGGTVSTDLSFIARSARAIRYAARILVGVSQR
jgi:hypothetical protein